MAEEQQAFNLVDAAFNACNCFRNLLSSRLYMQMGTNILEARRNGFICAMVAWRTPSVLRGVNS